MDLFFRSGKCALRWSTTLEVIEERRAIGFLHLVEVDTRLAKLRVDGLACGIGDRTLRIVGFHLIVCQRINQELLSHVLEEVLLAPAFEHPVGDDDDAQVPPAGQHGRLMTTLGKSRHLAQPKFASQKPYGLVIEEVLHRTSIELGLPQDEPLFGNTPNTAFAISHEVKTHLQQFLKEPGTPSPAVENDGHTPSGSDQFAHLFEYRYQHVCHGGVGFSGHDKERVSLPIIDPVVGGRRDRKAGPSVVAFSDNVFAVVGPNMAINVKETKHAASLRDTMTGQFAAESLAGLAGCQTRQFAPQRLDLR